MYKNTRKLWSAINAVLHNKKNKTKSITALKDSTQNGRKIYDPFKLTLILNNLFVSVGKNYAEKIPQSKIESVEYLQDVNQLSSFFFIPV